jgi:(2Fe-2S) ferredoxin
MVYFGIINEQSLKNPGILEELSIVSQKQKGSWNFLLVLAYEDELGNQIKKLQENMVPNNEGYWYNYFFMNDTLIVVYQDAVIKTSTNPDDWEEVIQYGFKHGIPINQLDFNPCTKDEAFELFDLE